MSPCYRKLFPGDYLSDEEESDGEDGDDEDEPAEHAEQEGQQAEQHGVAYIVY